jgi:hypothetical protein
MCFYPDTHKHIEGNLYFVENLQQGPPFRSYVIHSEKVDAKQSDTEKNVESGWTNEWPKKGKMNAARERKRENIPLHSIT